MITSLGPIFSFVDLRSVDNFTRGCSCMLSDASTLSVACVDSARPDGSKTKTVVNSYCRFVKLPLGPLSEI